MTDGSRAGFPASLESVEAILACHAVADGGDDTVTENDNQDLAFVEQWWQTLRPVIPLPVRPGGSGGETIHLNDTLEKEDGVQNRTPSRSSTQDWIENQELMAYRADEARMEAYWAEKDEELAMEQQKAKAAQEWDDWAMHQAMTASAAPVKRRRMVIKVYEDQLHGTAATSSHEVPLPMTGMVQLQLFMEDGGEVNSEATTRRVESVGDHGADMGEPVDVPGADLGGGVGNVSAGDSPDVVLDATQQQPSTQNTSGQST